MRRAKVVSLGRECVDAAETAPMVHGKVEEKAAGKVFVFVLEADFQLVQNK